MNTNTRWLAVMVSLWAFLPGCTQDWPTDPPDVVRPSVVAASPLDATLMVPTGTPLSLTFSEAMDALTLASCATVTTGAGVVVKGTWQGNGATFTFAPAVPFEQTTRYAVTVRGALDGAGRWRGPGARDGHGNSLGTDFNTGFTTAGPYGSSIVYLGKSDAFGESGSASGLGVFKGLSYSTLGSSVGDGEVGLSLSPTRSELYVMDGGTGSVQVLDPVTGNTLGTITLPDTATGPAAAAFSPVTNEAWILCRGNNCAVVVNTSTRQVTGVVPLAGDVNGGTLMAMKINNAGTRGYITTGAGLSLIVVDVPARSVITTVSGLVRNGDPWAKTEAVEITPDDARVIVACDYALPQLTVVDAATNTASQDVFLDPQYNSDTFLQIQGGVLYALGRWGLGLMKVDLAGMTVTATTTEFITETNTYGWMLGMCAGTDGVVYSLTYDGTLVLTKAADLSRLAILPAEIRKNMVVY